MMICIQVTFLNQESTRLLARARQAENGELDKSFNAAAEITLYLFLHPELNEMNEDDKVIFDDTTSYELVANSLTPANISRLLDGMSKGMIPIANLNDNKDM